MEQSSAKSRDPMLSALNNLQRVRGTIAYQPCKILPELAAVLWRLESRLQNGPRRTPVSAVHKKGLEPDGDGNLIDQFPSRFGTKLLKHFMKKSSSTSCGRGGIARPTSINALTCFTQGNTRCGDSLTRSAGIPRHLECGQGVCCSHFLGKRNSAAGA